MNHRIQIMVDDRLNKSIKAGAKKMGLSVSSFARLALMNGLAPNKIGLLQQAIEDIQKDQVESLSYNDFSDQIDER
jgi:peptidyl-tRNA hydrolase